MAYVCEIVDTATQACAQWAIYSPFLPELTDEARDELIKYVLKLLIGTFVVIKVVGLIKRT
ncbi:MULTISPECIES: hypothetical protein [Acinetobacter]|jgi:hypothetical protein|uniref:Uncharacterized protein n=1 Tax=Acinetobacter johnsonii TaxID=40214 RepID=A0AA42SSE0_ACIJO|nr:hypothetical protein [Acinetobacter johnsonii]MDH0969132.1 hypothetical protein [Acinetobacter johnsonii]MDH0969156.1 hypothetical protein [Acinetobacter johnsonii]QQT93767.1 hypothetical protein I6I51_03130 [Acinetobacter johnsonii]HCN35896.1 hypothetical protein [Acinetobacter johnsonii]